MRIRAIMFKNAFRSIFWHGTSINNLNKILKVGLIPDRKKKQYDRWSGDGFKSIKTYGGVYLASVFRTAFGYAGFASGNANERLLVACTLESRTPTALADEDDLSRFLVRVTRVQHSGEISNVINDLSWESNLFNWVTKVKQADLKFYVDKYIDSCLEIYPRFKERYSRIDKHYFRDLVERYIKLYFYHLKESDISHRQQKPKDAPEYLKNKRLDLGDKMRDLDREFENEIIGQVPPELKNTWPRLVKYTELISNQIPEMKDTPSKDYNLGGLDKLRFMEPITYRGGNKIIAVVGHKTEKNEETGNYDNYFTFYYGANQWRELLKQAKGSGMLGIGDLIIQDRSGRVLHKEEEPRVKKESVNASISKLRPLRSKKALYFNLKKELAQQDIHLASPIFHATSYKNAFGILNTGFKAREGGKGNDAYYDNAICFTRDLNYLLSNSFFGGTQAILVLDKNELKAAGFKVYPFEFNMQRYRDVPDMFIKKYWGKAKPNFEAEERVSRTAPILDKFNRLKENATKEAWDELVQEYLAMPETVIRPKFIKAVVVLGKITKSNQIGDYDSSYDYDSADFKKQKDSNPLTRKLQQLGIPVIEYQVAKDSRKVDYKPMESLEVGSYREFESVFFERLLNGDYTLDYSGDQPEDITDIDSFDLDLFFKFEGLPYNKAWCQKIIETMKSRSYFKYIFEDAEDVIFLKRGGSLTLNIYLHDWTALQWVGYRFPKNTTEDGLDIFKAYEDAFINLAE